MEEKHKITVCLGSSCFARGNEENLNFIEKYVKENNLNADVEISGSRCEGNGRLDPIITINVVLYKELKIKK